MENSKNPYELQLFICTNKKEKGECCANKGGAELRNELKTICHAKYGRRIRINAAGCMGGCEKGIIGAIYPQNLWFEKITIDDKDKLLAKLDEIVGE